MGNVWGSEPAVPPGNDPTMTAVTPAATAGAGDDSKTADNTPLTLHNVADSLARGKYRKVGVVVGDVCRATDHRHSANLATYLDNPIMTCKQLGLLGGHVPVDSPCFLPHAFVALLAKHGLLARVYVETYDGWLALHGVPAQQVTPLGGSPYSFSCNLCGKFAASDAVLASMRAGRTPTCDCRARTGSRTSGFPPTPGVFVPDAIRDPHAALPINMAALLDEVQSYDLLIVVKARGQSLQNRVTLRFMEAMPPAALLILDCGEGGSGNGNAVETPPDDYVLLTPREQKVADNPSSASHSSSPNTRSKDSSSGSLIELVDAMRWLPRVNAHSHSMLGVVRLDIVRTPPKPRPVARKPSLSPSASGVETQQQLPPTVTSSGGVMSAIWHVVTLGWLWGSTAPPPADSSRSPEVDGPVIEDEEDDAGDDDDDDYDDDKEQGAEGLSSIQMRELPRQEDMAMKPTTQMSDQDISRQQGATRNNANNVNTDVQSAMATPMTLPATPQHKHHHTSSNPFASPPGSGRSAARSTLVTNNPFATPASSRVSATSFAAASGGTSPFTPGGGVVGSTNGGNGNGVSHFAAQGPSTPSPFSRTHSQTLSSPYATPHRVPAAAGATTANDRGLRSPSLATPQSTPARPDRVVSVAGSTSTTQSPLPSPPTSSRSSHQLEQSPHPSPPTTARSDMSSSRRVKSLDAMPVETIKSRVEKDRWLKKEEQRRVEAEEKRREWEAAIRGDVPE